MSYSKPAKDFLKAADSILQKKKREEKRLHNAEQAKARGQEKLESEFGQILSAIRGLPEGHVAVAGTDVEGGADKSYAIRIALGNARTGNGGTVFEVCGNDKNGKKLRRKFAECRARIGKWIATEYPHSVPELKKALKKSR